MVDRANTGTPDPLISPLRSAFGTEHIGPDRPILTTTPPLRTRLSTLCCSPMIKGTLLTESLRIRVPLAVAGLRVTGLERRCVSGTATQPAVWTFLEFEADDDVAWPRPPPSRPRLRSKAGGMRTLRRTPTTSWSLRTAPSAIGAMTPPAGWPPRRTVDPWVCRTTSSTGRTSSGAAQPERRWPRWGRCPTDPVAQRR